MTNKSQLDKQPQQERQREILEDNARKFTVKILSPALLQELDASGYALTTDWLETGEDTEKKVVSKRFQNGDTQLLLISKVTKDGNRTSDKQKITDEQYAELLGLSILRVEKMRYEFDFVQHNTPFSMKYDEFSNTQLCVLEVDAASDSERNSFNPKEFPSELSEVTGDIRYYGYRVAGIMQRAKF
jgi:hypothetical protein